ncbi:hypothetical protein DFQ29_001538 [Apophysomyces sp. BC1021]|nr:hypothetical protein DFQ29_001538 [Apophysomyces sp. BC1021]
MQIRLKYQVASPCGALDWERSGNMNRLQLPFLFVTRPRLIPKAFRAMSTNTTSEKPVLALPSTAEETVQPLGLNDNYKLKELGPVVVNENGTLSRINNWYEMSDIERANVNRILLKRNRQRLEKLKQQEDNATA